MPTARIRRSRTAVTVRAACVDVLEPRRLLAGVTFTIPVPHQAPADMANTLTAMAVADFDGNGTIDVLAGTSASRSSFWSGRGDGTFAPPTVLPVQMGSNDTAVADFDGDGLPDVVSVWGGSGNNLFVQVSNGDGTFRQTHASSTQGWNVVAGEFTGDGKADFLVTDWSAVKLYPGRGDGTFGSPSSTSLPARTGWLISGDVDGDGDLDAVGTSGALLNQGDGTFVRREQAFPGVVAPGVGDVNGDGRLDMILGASDAENMTLMVRLGVGDGTFTAGATVFVAPEWPEVYTDPSPTSYALRDLDLDGKLDLVVLIDGREGPKGILVTAPGNGDGTFGAIGYVSLPRYQYDLQLADLNGGGTPDPVIRWMAPDDNAPTSVGLTSMLTRRLAVTMAGFAATQYTPLTNQLVATFADGDFPGVNPGYRATVQWGDGTTSAGTITASNGVYEVRASHTFETRGTVTVTVMVDDAEGTRAQATRQLTVAPFDPQANADVRLLADVGITGLGTAVQEHVYANGYLFFTAPSHGISSDLAVWRTDGTAVGTVELFAAFGSDATKPRSLTAAGDSVYFVAATGDTRQLYRTDGTPGAVEKVTRFTYLGGAFGELVAAGQDLFFVYNNGQVGGELWKTDGTWAGTVQVKDVKPGQGSSLIDALTPVDDVVYFTADDGTHGVELWRTDGTGAGTAMVADLALGATSSVIASPTAVGDELFFRIDTASHGGELWVADSAGARMVTELVAGPTGSDPVHLTAAGGRLFFQASGPTGLGLWTSDGTVGGTRLVQLLPGLAASGGAPMTAVGSAVFFAGSTDGLGSELWTSDGTASGTRCVADIYAGTGSSNPAGLVGAGGTLYFTATTAAGTELWRSDGTAAGTRMVIDLMPVGASTGPSKLTAGGTSVYFVADDGLIGSELWKSDGTAAGTRGLDLTPNAGSSYPRHLVSLGGSVVFQAGSNPGLWRTDGTHAGTVKFHPTLRFSDGGYYGLNTKAVLQGLLYFGSATSTGLWRTDGTTAGTTMVRSYVSAPQSMVVSNGKLFFTASDGAAGQELWVSDGTSAGTRLVKDIRPGSGNADIYQVTDVGGTVFFFARESSTGPLVLYKSDGTDAGTVRVSDVVWGQSHTADCAQIVDFNGRALFTGASAGAGRELWISDGTPAGTIRLTDIRAGSMDSMELQTPLVVLGDGAYFTAYDNGLWRTDGTAVGTVPLATYANGPRGFAAFGGELFFNTYTGSSYELWATDGTAAGLRLVKTLANTARPGSNSPSSLHAVGDRAFFAADVTDLGVELWMTDGTTAGTVLARDIYAGLGDARPANLLTANGTVFFTATDADHGTELWGVPASAPPAAAPSALAATVVGNDVELTWSYAGTDHNGLLLQRSTDAAFATIDLDVRLPAGLRRHTDTTTGPAVTYYYRVMAQNPAGTSAPAVVAVTTPARPADPADFAGRATSQTVVRLTWQDRATNETGYVLERSASATFGTIDFSVALGPDLTSYDDTGLAANARYYYRLRAVNALGSSRPVTTEARTLDWPPLPPGSLQATNLSATVVRLTWSDNATNELGYRVERSTSPAFDPVESSVILGTNGHSWDDAGLTDGVTYYYRVCAYGTGGDSAAAVVSIRAQEVAPAAPASLYADAMTLGTVGLTWTDLAINEDAYVVERREGTGAFYGLATLAANQTSYTDASVYNGLVYTYRVIATNRVGAAASNLASAAAPGEARRVADVNVLTIGTDPQEVTGANGTVYFFGTSTSQGRGLFKSDGTAQGTVLLRAGWGYMPHGLTAVGNRAFFFTGSALSGCEVWTSDGTAEGTVRVPADTEQPSMWRQDTKALGTAGGLFFFRLGNVLWRSDGTLGGTYSVRNFDDWRDGYTPWILPVDDELWFVVKPQMSDPTSIFRSDGTAAGTNLVTQGPEIAELVRVGNDVYFTRQENGYLRSVWRTDGTAAGTVAITDPAGPYRDPRWLHEYNGQLLFIATVDSQPQLVRYAPGGAFSAAAVPRLPVALSGTAPTWRNGLGKVVFAATSSTSSMELWSTDGTVPGTTLVATFTGLTDQYGGVRDLTAVGSRVLFLVSGSGGAAVWRTDGTAAGTAALCPAGGSKPRIVADGARAFFPAFTPVEGAELWVSDGTPTGTRLAGDPTGQPIGSAAPAGLTPDGDALFFSATDGQQGTELWVLDRTTGVAALVKDIAPGAASGLGTSFASGARRVSQGVLYFAANDGVHGEELWRSDGTDAGTYLVADLSAGPTGSALTSLFAFGGTLWFNAGGQTYRLVDGTPQAVELSESVPFGTQRLSMASAGSHLYLVTQSGLTSDLWVLADDDAAWQRLRTFTDNPADGISSPPPRQLVDVNGTLFFAGADQTYARLWTSDGTVAGTVAAGPTLNVVNNLTPFGPGDPRLFCTARVGTATEQLWAFDSATAQLTQLTTFTVSNSWAASTTGPWTTANGAVYFGADSGSGGGRELWRSDGTVAGTRMVRDINRLGNSSPVQITALDDLVYFVAYDSYGANQVWRSDGSAEGTFRVSDIRPGAAAPTGLVAWDNRVYFAGTDADTGAELWSVVAPPWSPPAPASPVVNTAGVTLTWSGGGGVVTEYLIERMQTSAPASAGAGLAALGTTGADGYALLARVPADTLVFVDGEVQAGQQYVYRIRAANEGGVSSASAEVQALVPSPLAAPTIASISDDTGTPGDGITSDNTPALSGTAEPGSRVQVFRDGSPVSGPVTADSLGDWSFTSAALADGPYAFTAVATDAAGNASDPSGPLAVTIDTTAPTLASAVSRKVHSTAGTFDVNLSLTGTTRATGATIEPRKSGPTQLVFNFSEPIVAQDGLLDGTEFLVANASFVSATLADSTLTVNLTNVQNARYVTVQLLGLADPAGNALAGDTDVTIGALYGDIDQSGSVNLLDFQRVKLNLLQPLTASNFLADLDGSGSVNLLDFQVIKVNLLKGLS